MPDGRRQTQSFHLKNAPVITHWASVAGKKEAEGPLGTYFDITSKDPYWGQKTWELAEAHMQQLSLQSLCQKADNLHNGPDLVLSGDLLNQCFCSSYHLRNKKIPYLGLYGACSTMAEGLLVASMAVSGGFMRNAAVITSSHFASSERQYRFPLGYGGQRTPSAQWTVTGAGSVLLSSEGIGPRITACTIGTICEHGIKDASNMGAAMAPAAYETINGHFHDLCVCASDYDLIITGDLGQLGKELLLDIALRNGLELAGKLVDCGTLIYDLQKQGVHSGGSGCGCSAIVLCSYFLNKLAAGKLKRILFCGTGALLSPVSTQQSLPIPAICHAISISAEGL